MKPRPNCRTQAGLVLILLALCPYSSAQSVDSERVRVESPERVRKSLLEEDRVKEADLVFLNLDEDEDEEAVVSWTDWLNAGVSVLDRIDGEWYRVATSSSRVNYEPNPMKSYIMTIRQPMVVLHGSWSHDFFATRNNYGGTGVYTRDMEVYRLRDARLVEIFRLSPERLRSCPGVIHEGATPTEITCEVIVKQVEPTVNIFGKPVIVVDIFEGEVPMEDQRVDAVQGGLGMSGFPITRRECYVWNETAFRFVLSDTGTATNGVTDQKRECVI